MISVLTCMQTSKDNVFVEYYVPGAGVDVGGALVVDECGVVAVGTEIKTSYSYSNRILNTCAPHTILTPYRSFSYITT